MTNSESRDKATRGDSPFIVRSTSMPLQAREAWVLICGPSAFTAKKGQPVQGLTQQAVNHSLQENSEDVFTRWVET